MINFFCLTVNRRGMYRWDQNTASHLQSAQIVLNSPRNILKEGPVSTANLVKLDIVEIFYQNLPNDLPKLKCQKPFTPL